MGEEFWEERVHFTILYHTVSLTFLDVTENWATLAKMRTRTQYLQPYKRLSNQCAIYNGLHCTSQRKRHGARLLSLIPALDHSTAAPRCLASPASSPTGFADCILDIKLSQLQYHIVSPFSGRLNHWIWNKSAAIKNGHEDGMMTFVKINRIGIISYLQKYIEKDVKGHIPPREGSEI